jgi:hypothetical protein
MKKPEDYLMKAGRCRNGGFACLVLIALLGPVLGASLLRRWFWWSVITGGIVALLFCAGMGLLALARRHDQRAVALDYLRSLEVKAQKRRAYPRTLSPLVRER